MKDHEHPFFRPLWRRIAIVAVCAGWSIFEFASGAQMWGMIAAAFTAYAVWQFFYLYNPAEPAPATEAGEPAQTADGGGPEKKE